MKKRYFAHALMGCFLLLCIHQSTAQTLYPFPSPGLIQTEVYHQDWTQMFAPRNNSFVHTGDTIVGSYTYSRFSSLPVGSSNPWYTCYDSGRVYYTFNSTPANPQTGIFLYDFNLGVGDTFAIGSFAFGGTFTVDLVSTVTLPNTQTRKYLRLVNGTDTLEWIDGIGDINWGFFYSTDFEGGYEELVCIQDSAGPLYNVLNSSYYCDPYNPIPTSGPNTCDQFAFNAQVYGTSCAGCDGSITITNVTGGTPGYTYSWSNGATTPNVSGLCQGPITLTITDAASLSCSRTFMVGQNSIIANIQHTNFDVCDGIDTICVVPSGGNPPYFYVWAPMMANTQCIYPTSNGTYTIQVGDANGCSSTVTVVINNPVPMSITEQVTTPSCSNCCDGGATLNVTGGTPPYSYIWSPTSPTPGQACPGIYSWCVTDSMGCTFCDTVSVLNPMAVDDPVASVFSVAPNPANNFLDVTRSSAQPTQVVITDVQGKIIRREMYAGLNLRMDVSELAPGLYFLVIDDHTEKLVITRGN